MDSEIACEMDIEYIHFYVEDAIALAHRFHQQWGFHRAGGWQDETARHERLTSGQVRFLLSSPLGSKGAVADYLARHPPGVADLALRVSDLASLLRRALALGARLFEQSPGEQAWAVISGWGDLRHTLVQGDRPMPSNARFDWPASPPVTPFERVDHVVLNVAAGELQPALRWYQRLLGLEPRQAFHIQTAHSGLRSQVLVGQPSQAGVSQRLQLPINEPTSELSQIQEFLDHNGGTGIQHVALLTPDLLTVVEQLRHSAVDFLAVPPTYYPQLTQRPGFGHQNLTPDWPRIVAQQVLVDWQEPSPSHALEARLEGPLLQIFTQPVFQQPTFFFELIERRRLTPAASPAQGFGEGNFRALFEAIEREQRSRLGA